jgi:hypothetical protein
MRGDGDYLIAVAAACATRAIFRPRAVSPGS